jgi:hypothetical protein
VQPGTSYASCAVLGDAMFGVGRSASMSVKRHSSLSFFLKRNNNNMLGVLLDRLCGLVVRVLDYRSGGPGSIPGTTRKKLVGLERGPLSLVSTTDELLGRKVTAPV